LQICKFVRRKCLRHTKAHPKAASNRFLNPDLTERTRYVPIKYICSAIIFRLEVLS